MAAEATVPLDIVLKHIQEIAPACKDKSALEAKVKAFVGDREVIDEDGDAVELDLADFSALGGEAGDESKSSTEDIDDIVAKAVADALAKRDEEARKARKSRRIPFNPETKSDPIPATAKRTNVKSFKGPDADYKAYAFGQLYFASLGSERAKSWLAKEGMAPQFDRENATKAMSAVNPSSGGVFVPEVMANDLIRLVEEYGVFRRNSRVVPMSSDTLTIPRRAGGVTAYFVGESTAPTESNSTYNTVSLTARKLMTLTRMPSELMEDAVMSVGDLLATEIALDFANTEDDCGFNGTGTSTYGGIEGVLPFAGSASVVTAATGNTAFSTLDLADFHSVVGKLPRYAVNGAKWYISAAGFADSMQRLAYAGGGNTVDNINGGIGLSFLGYPVEITQILNSTLTAQTSTAILAFGNLALGTLFGDRRATSIATDASRYFDQDQIAVRGIQRFDIVCHSFDSTSTAGPVIVLKTPAS